MYVHRAFAQGARPRMCVYLGTMKAVQRSFGSLFVEYCETEGCTLADIAADLGCDTETLSWLSLCRRPTVEDCVTKIVERVSINAVKLVEILRRVDARVLASVDDLDTAFGA